MVSIKFSDPHSTATFTIPTVESTPQQVEERIRKHILMYSSTPISLVFGRGDTRIMVPFFMLTNYTIEIKYIR